MNERNNIDERLYVNYITISEAFKRDGWTCYHKFQAGNYWQKGFDNESSMDSVQHPTACAHRSMQAACCAPRSTSLLKSLPSGAATLSASVSAPARRDATTCVAPPAEQPCCSNGENR